MVPNSSQVEGKHGKLERARRYTKKASVEESIEKRELCIDIN
jgi:hypothetical protein